MRRRGVRGRAAMQCALERLVYMSLREQLGDRYLDELRIGILRAIDKTLAHHLDDPREVRRRIDPQASQVPRPSIPSTPSTTPPDDGGGIT